MERTLNDLLAKFLWEEPFFASIIRNMIKEETNQIPTAGVSISGGSFVLYWNKDFLNSLSLKECMGLLKHECYHLIFKHIFKRRHDPHLLWNIATDLAINSIIPVEELPKGGFIPGEFLELPENMPEKEREKRLKVSMFIQSLPKNKTSEWYMVKLLENQEISDILEETLQGDSDCPGFDHHFDISNEDSVEREILERKVGSIVEKAVKDADKSNGWGTVSQSVKEMIRSAFSKEISWQDVLRKFCGNKQRANKSRSFRKINRKYPYVHPGRKIAHTSNIAIYIDQSGSVSDSDLKLLFENLNTLAKKTKFTVYHFDTEVDAKSKFVWDKRKTVTKPYRTRSGGTNFNSVEKFHRKIQSNYDGYIILTDGEAPKPDNCKSKRCWIVLPNRKLYFIPDKRDVVVNMKR